MAVVNANTPLVDKTTNQDFYPLTAYNQIVMPDGTRWDGTDYGASIDTLNDDIQTLQTDVAELKKGIKVVTLWENPNPTSSFAKQNISIPNIFTYPILILEYKNVKGSTQTQTVTWLTKDSWVVYTSAVNGFKYRVVHITDTGLGFDVGMVQDTNPPITNNEVAVPVALYGVS